MQCRWDDAIRMAQKGRTMRVRTVFDLGTDAIYIGTHDLLIVDADLSEAELDRMVKTAEMRRQERPSPKRHRHLRAL